MSSALPLTLRSSHVHRQASFDPSARANPVMLLSGIASIRVRVG
jgi:hypothetical protein